MSKKGHKKITSRERDQIARRYFAMAKYLRNLLNDLDMKTYFADPYSSWQRGTNEYHNGVLRRYLPKGTDFDTIDDEELNDIVEEINNKPRKCLGWSTPKEIFTKLAGVRIQS